MRREPTILNRKGNASINKPSKYSKYLLPSPQKVDLKIGKKPPSNI
jgi:hypothetical protein